MFEISIPATTPNDVQLIHNSGENKTEIVSQDSGIIPNPKAYLTMKPAYYYGITLTTYFIVVLLSIVVGDVRVFFGIIGTTVSSWGIYAGPGSFFIIAVHKKKAKMITFADKFLYVLSWIFILIGLCIFGGLGPAVILNQFA